MITDYIAAGIAVSILVAMLIDVRRKRLRRQVKGATTIAIDEEMEAVIIKNPDYVETRAMIDKAIREAKTLHGIIDTLRTQRDAFGAEVFRLHNALADHRRCIDCRYFTVGSDSDHYNPAYDAACSNAEADLRWRQEIGEKFSHARFRLYMQVASRCKDFDPIIDDRPEIMRCEECGHFDTVANFRRKRGLTCARCHAAQVPPEVKKRLEEIERWQQRKEGEQCE